jgi:L-asparagine transporter-like permease
LYATTPSSTTPAISPPATLAYATVELAGAARATLATDTTAIASAIRKAIRRIRRFTTVTFAGSARRSFQA